MKRDIVITAVARRYAKAMLGAAIDQRNFSLVLDQMESFSDQLHQSPMLLVVFLNPAVPHDRKRKILNDVGGKMGFVPLTLNLLNSMIENGRLPMLEQVITSAEQQFLDRQGILVAEVVSARKLSAQEEQKLTRRLEAFTGKQVQLENRIDRTLIGGMITKIGTTLYDGTVVSQLEDLKTRIIEEKF